MMTTLFFPVLIALFAVPLWCLGLRTVTDYKEGSPISRKLFWRVREYFLRRFPEAGKPVITCVACMPSLHTFIVLPFIWSMLSIPLGWNFVACAIFVAVSSSFISAHWWRKFNSNGY